MPDAVARWQELVDRRRRQMDAANAAAAIRSEDYWAHRAAQYARGIKDVDPTDPFLRLVLERVTPESTVIDVGAGTGRHAVPLARAARRVIAVDPSPSMLQFLRRDAGAAGVRNIEVIEAAWPDVDAPRCDIAICSHVLYPIHDIVRFLSRLDEAATWCYVYLRADPLATDMGLWREFHGEALTQQPTHQHALGVLHEMGIYPNVAVYRLDARRTFADWNEAVDQARRSVCMPDTPEMNARVRDLLVPLMGEMPDGGVSTYPSAMRTAVIWWGPDQRPPQGEK